MRSNQLHDQEYPPFYANYIKGLGDVNLIEILESSLNDLSLAVENLSEEKLAYRYEIGKWTIKELIQHIIDAERVLSYRALRFSRQDTKELHGFDEDWYVKYSNGDDRDIKDLTEELSSLRKANISMFKGFTNAMLTSSGWQMVVWSQFVPLVL